ncbi:hypothetical protein F4808DRAFT_444064 [Astrocystis sublimbata]|nr:hypothetical protein F4808DRAFT_444064 [Astrocystis sublimbata]
MSLSFPSLSSRHHVCYNCSSQLSDGAEVARAAIRKYIQTRPMVPPRTSSVPNGARPHMLCSACSKAAKLRSKQSTSFLSVQERDEDHTSTSSSSPSSLLFSSSPKRSSEENTRKRSGQLFAAPSTFQQPMRDGSGVQLRRQGSAHKSLRELINGDYDNKELAEGKFADEVAEEEVLVARVYAMLQLENSPILPCLESKGAEVSGLPSDVRRMLEREVREQMVALQIGVAL